MVPPVGHADLTAQPRARRRVAPAVPAVLAVLAVAILAMLLSPVLGVPGAVAHPATLPGPASFSEGIVDDPTFLDPYASEATRTSWFAAAHRIAAGWIRLGVYWQFIAPARPAQPSQPSDPGYSWGVTDAAVRDAAAHHIRLLLEIGYPPSWALGAHPPRDVSPNTWRPNAALFGQFARVVATRYTGRYPDPLRPQHTLPRVTSFQIWNEPNLRINLAPQWTHDQRGRPMPASPGIYRALLNAGYANVKAVQPHSTVLAAGLGPYGDPPGVDRMHPVAFMGELLCLRGVTTAAGTLPESGTFRRDRRPPVRTHPDAPRIQPRRRQRA